MFVTGPDVVHSVTGEDVDMASLGGPDTHHKKSGVCHIVADDEADAYERGRRLVGLFCQQGHFDRSKAEAHDTDLHALLPESPRRAYDVHPLVIALLDDDAPFEEFQAKWAPSMVVGLGRLSGRSVGVLANNPLRLGGCLNSESAEKAARFVRLCDAFGIPLVVIVDVPGYLPGVDQEWAGVVRRGAKLLHAFGESHRSARHPGHPKDLWRGLHCDEFTFVGRHQGVRLAGRRGRRDGRQGSRRDSAQEEAGGRAGPRARGAAR